MFSRARSCRQGAHDHRSTLFQEHLDVAYEWLVVRSGDACHGYPKGRVGAFHSGSGRAQWDVPQHHHLEFLHRVTELGPFGSMHIDAFETRDECLMVNELQASFGAGTTVDKMRVHGVPGRMLRLDDACRFEPGDFVRSAFASARVLGVLERRRV